MGSTPNKQKILKEMIQRLQKLLLKLSHKNNKNKKILVNYSFLSWLFLKKLQKEGFIRNCVIKQSPLNFENKNSKVLIEISVIKPLNNLGLMSSINFRTNLKKDNNSQNLGLIFNSNSTQSSLIKSFGEIFLILK